jgi:amino acid transporter
MKPAGIVGLVLITIGIIALAYGGFSYTTREKALDAGPLEVSADKKKTVPLSPLLGAICLGGGIVLVLAGTKET